jgi:DedD protein
MMERALKERIIGAAVLVVVVVLVVPVFLDGPPDSGEIVSERVPLPGQADQQVKTQILELDRTVPVPANSGQAQPAQVVVVQEATSPAPAAAQTESKPVPKPVPNPIPEPVDEKPVEKKPEPAATSSSTGMWAVQLGSFGNQENAERLAADLRKQGFAAFLSQLSTDSGQLHRVRVGPQKDRQSAEAMAERLEKAGHKGKVLPHP